MIGSGSAYLAPTGFGDIPLPQTIGGSLTTGLTTAVAVTGGAIIPLDIAAGVVALTTGLLGAFGVGVPDVKKIQATHVVDQIEPYLKQNIQWWNSVPHTVANQAQGLSIFNAAWAQVVASCSDPNLGSAGQNCIGDRTRGGKWDWYSYYYDPIANAQLVDASGQSVGADGGGIVGSVNNLTSGLGVSGLLVVGILAIVIGVKLI